jgi:hypothetical protein
MDFKGKTASKLNKKRISLRQSINNKCKDCIYDPVQKGSWREQVENCTSSACPLFDVRPKSTKKLKR